MKLNIKKVYDEARRLVEESPDNIYKAPDGEYADCSYIKGKCSNGSVGCLFGQAIKNVHPNFDLEPHEGEGIRLVLDESFVFGGIPHFCSYVQSAQDGGSTWKNAWNDSIDNDFFNLNVEEVE